MVSSKSGDRGVQVFENDSIRFGRSIVKVVRLQPTANLSTPVDESFQQNSAKKHSQLEIGQHPANSDFCRICKESSTASSPLSYDLCGCAQESPVHLDCFYEWLRRRVVKRFNANATFIDLSKMRCEKCGTFFPNEYPLADRKARVFDVDKPIRNPHVILAVAAPASEDVVGFYIYSFDKKMPQATLRVGSDLEREVQLLDHYVASFHARINWVDGKLFVADNNSETGTAVKLSYVVGFETLEKQKLLVDRYLLSAHLLQAGKPCSCLKGVKEIQTDPLVKVASPNLSIASKQEVKLPTRPASVRAEELRHPQASLSSPPTPQAHHSPLDNMQPGSVKMTPQPSKPTPFQPEERRAGVPDRSPIPQGRSTRFDAEAFRKPVDAGLLSVYTEVERKPNLIKMEFAMDNQKMPQVHQMRPAESYDESAIVRQHQIDEAPLSNFPSRRAQPMPEVPETISPIASRKLDSSLNEWRERNVVQSRLGQAPGTSEKNPLARQLSFHPEVDGRLFQGSGRSLTNRDSSPHHNYNFN